MLADNSQLRSAVARRLLTQPKQPDDTPMFNPDVAIDNSNVVDDTQFAETLGKVFGDIPIRSAYDKLYRGPNPEVPGYGHLSFGRDSGILALPESGTLTEGGYQFASDDAMPGEFNGNVFGDRTGDYTQTGNSQGPIDILAIIRFLQKRKAEGFYS